MALFVGLYWVIAGVNYGLWVRNGPGPGFLPVLGGLLTMVFCMAILWQNREKESPIKFNPKAFLPVGALLAMVLLSHVLGLLISMTLFIFLWLRIAERQSPAKSLTISLGTVLVVYAVFVAWLRVPFPKGFLGLL
ncbi:MAG: tripartite tricarboxylate transporter TctB family protein [Limnochordia bacterium]